MTVALATRGYICQGGVGFASFGPGPSIFQTDELAPEIDGSVVQEADAPAISGANLVEPNIVAAEADPAPSTPDAPTIAGGVVVAPIIVDGGEE